MTRRIAVLLCVLIVTIAGREASADRHALSADIGRVIDDFHAAAARGDKTRYLGLMTDDAVFLGTDEWERWPKEPSFREYVAARFRDGSGWSYRSVERVLSIGDEQDVAWFDEVLESQTNGRFRGTGVVLRTADGWKIAHYAMSFLVSNDDWNAVIELNQRRRAQRAADAAND